MAPGAASPILFFDGECNLCNGLVQFVLKHDKKKIFFFSPLQSAAGRDAVTKAFNTKIGNTDSFILCYNGVYYSRSSAALYVFRLLGGLWSLLFLGMIFPRALRDGLYNVVSRNRYKWFGKRESCMVPTPEVSARFLL